MTAPAADRRPRHRTASATTYLVSAASKEAFRRDGYVHLEAVLSEDELVEIEAVYERFLRGEIAVAGKDLNDMTTGEHGSDPSGYAIVNVMVPRRYYPAWQGNVFERRATSIATQLCGEGMVIDFDQLLAKQPGRDDAVFAWHQDQAYWIDTDDRRTATCWLAVDDSTVENGCMQFLPGSHREPVRPHHPLHGDRDASHTLVTELRPGDVMRPCRSAVATSPCTARACCTAPGATPRRTRGVAPTSSPCVPTAPSRPSGRAGSPTRTTTTSPCSSRSTV